MKIIPIGDKVVIQRIEADDRTAGGIVLPDTARNGSTQGRVLSVGDGIALANGERAGFQVREGDRVIYSGYAGTEINVDGETLLVLSEADILAVVS